jgi:hypothetical protein
MKTFLVLPLFLFIVGCAAMIAPSKEEAANADYGSYPSDYEDIVSNWINETLFDPYSVRDLNVQSPQRYWLQASPIMGGSTTYGYLVQFSLNAKNRMGGYVGKKYYNMLIRNGIIQKVWEKGDI